jgi:hypothetical protein
MRHFRPVSFSVDSPIVGQQTNNSFAVVLATSCFVAQE